MVSSARPRPCRALATVYLSVWSGLAVGCCGVVSRETFLGRTNSSTSPQLSSSAEADSPSLSPLCWLAAVAGFGCPRPNSISPASQPHRPATIQTWARLLVRVVVGLCENSASPALPCAVDSCGSPRSRRHASAPSVRTYGCWAKLSFRQAVAERYVPPPFSRYIGPSCLWSRGEVTVTMSGAVS
ncbi:uncharacterized protein IWZ02DRAFT_151981 [Phyllosticta citriasiana]|uniref:uncharacterized protein n=1 Tax=Phyllosticta citriasiana TaxID=595635 RepID=UPI0030FD48C5